jgi:hypothetical protein
MKTRTLKIESTGDFWAGKICPKIRLSGQWLEKAGFKPGNRVELSFLENGAITLRCIQETICAPSNCPKT